MINKIKGGWQVDGDGKKFLWIEVINTKAEFHNTDDVEQAIEIVIEEQRKLLQYLENNKNEIIKELT